MNEQTQQVHKQSGPGGLRIVEAGKGCCQSPCGVLSRGPNKLALFLSEKRCLLESEEIEQV